MNPFTESPLEWETEGSERIASICERHTYTLKGAERYHACSAIAATGNIPINTDYERFPVKSLYDICPESRSWPTEKIVGLRTRELAEIGHWTTKDNVWTMALAMATPLDRDPFAPTKPVELLLFTTCTLPTELVASHHFSVRKAFRVSLEEPLSVLAVDGSPEVFVAGPMEVERCDEFHTTTLRYLNASAWRDVLERLSYFNHKQLFIHFDIRAEIRATACAGSRGIAAKLENQHDVLNTIAESGQLSLLDVASLRATCRALRSTLTGVAEHRLCVALALYFPGALSTFACALRDHRAIVGGSTMLSIIKPGPWTPGDLDIVVPQDRSSSFVAFLIRQGYQRHQTRRGILAYLPAFNANRPSTFRYACFIREGHKIDVCTTLYDRTAASHILTYHSTAVMNFYDGRSIFCLFPELTFTGVFLRNRYNDSRRESFERAISKLVDRGFVEKYLRGGIYIQDWLPHAIDREGKLDPYKLPPAWCHKIASLD